MSLSQLQLIQISLLLYCTGRSPDKIPKCYEKVINFLEQILAERSWLLLLFPTGLIVAINFRSNSISAKTFYVLKAALTLPGQCIFYGSLGLLH